MMHLILTVIPLVFFTAVNSEPCNLEQPACPTFGTEYELILLPVITDCSKYIMCQRGTPIVRPCPGNLIFNVKLKVCDFPSRTECIKCDPDEKPEISTTVTTIAAATSTIAATTSTTAATQTSTETTSTTDITKTTYSNDDITKTTDSSVMDIRSTPSTAEPDISSV